MFGIGAKVVAAIGGGAAVMATGAALFFMIQRNTLHNEIHDPETGYIIRLERANNNLATCRTNRITLEDANTRRNEAVAAAHEEGERRVATLQRQLDTARRNTANAQRRADQILAAQPGDDECASANALILGEVNR